MHSKNVSVKVFFSWKPKKKHACNGMYFFFLQITETFYLFFLEIPPDSIGLGNT